MGNYYPGAKNKSPKKKGANLENISKLPVFSVYCAECKILLSDRCCQIRLASDLEVNGYSTDTTPEKVVESKSLKDAKNGLCSGCKTFCAIHSIYLCEYCRKQPTNGHKWIFLTVTGEETEEKWCQLQPKPIQSKNFQELLQFIGVSPQGLQILKKEKITSFQQLHQLSNELLKQAGICLGDIGKLRQLK